MRKAKITRGTYAGRVGKASEPNELGLVMFYTIEEIDPYCVCFSTEDIVWLN